MKLLCAAGLTAESAVWDGHGTRCVGEDVLMPLPDPRSGWRTKYPAGTSRKTGPKMSASWGKATPLGVQT